MAMEKNGDAMSFQSCVIITAVPCGWYFGADPGKMVTVKPGFHIAVSVVSVVRKKFIGQI